MHHFLVNNGFVFFLEGTTSVEGETWGTGTGAGVGVLKTTGSERSSFGSPIGSAYQQGQQVELQQWLGHMAWRQVRCFKTLSNWHQNCVLLLGVKTQSDLTTQTWYTYMFVCLLINSEFPKLSVALCPKPIGSYWRHTSLKTTHSYIYIYIWWGLFSAAGYYNLVALVLKWMHGS